MKFQNHPVSKSCMASGPLAPSPGGTCFRMSGAKRINSPAQSRDLGRERISGPSKKPESGTMPLLPSSHLLSPTPPSLRGLRALRGKNLCSESGMALVIVLSMLALVTVVAVSFTMFSLMEGRNARNFLKSAQGNFLMNMALGDAMGKIAAGSPQVGSQYYWVSAPGRLWRVGGVNSVGATNKISATSSNFAPSYATNVSDGSPDYSTLSNESGYINLYSEATNVFNATQVGFNPTNTFVDMNGVQRGYKIAPDVNPSGLPGASQTPLTVQWVQIARDMTQPINSNNPVVGRYAYWVDAENARLNINDVGISDIANRVGWRGLSPQEFAVDGVLSGITGADLDSYRLPLPVVIGSPNLPLTTYTNTSFFRRVDDLRMAGITDANIKNNAFYLTAVGRDIEVDNGGRLPINLDAYNGSINGVTAISGLAQRNNPMAYWAGGFVPPSTTPGGPDVVSDQAGYDTWLARQAANVAPYQNVQFIDEGMGIPPDFVIGDTCKVGWEDINPGNPGGAPPRLSGRQWAGDGTNYSGENLFIFSDQNRSTNSLDWLMPRLMGMVLPAISPTKPFTVGYSNRFSYFTNIATAVPYDISVNQDVVTMARLTQQTDATVQPNWFVQLSGTNNARTPEQTTDGKGKYSWNEMSQIFANMNSWRQTNVIEEAQGNVTMEGGNGSLNWIKADEFHNPITKGVGLMPAESNIQYIVRANNHQQPVVLNQNIGNRPLPYVNEIGMSVQFYGTGPRKIKRLTLHLELWNPSYPFEQMKNMPYSLGIVAIMPEAPYTTGYYITTNSAALRLPDPIFTGGSTYTLPNDVSENNTFGYYLNPERYRTWTYRTISRTDPHAGYSSFPYISHGGADPLIKFMGSIWKTPGNTINKMVAHGTKMTNNQSNPDSDSTYDANGNGGRYSVWGNTIPVPHATHYLNRIHIPGSSDAGRYVVIENAHLIDWRVPQRIDISLIPDGAFGNSGITPDYPSPGSHPIAENGYLTIDNADGGLYNAAVAVGLMQLPNSSDVRYGVNLARDMPTLASGLKGNTREGAIPDGTFSPFYQIVPQPRVNPGDEMGMGHGFNMSGGFGLPQTKYLPLIEMTTAGLGGGQTAADGGDIYTYSREVDDPMTGSRVGFIDFTKINSASEANNLVNTYDANDWGPLLYNTDSSLSASGVDQLPIANFKGGIDTGGPGDAGEQFETATGTLVHTNANAYTGTDWIGLPGIINHSLTSVTTNNGWSSSGTNWGTSLGSAGSKAAFTGWGDGDGDLTSQLIKQNDFEHPAELGYVHSGRPWRTLRFGKTETNSSYAGQPPDWYLFDQFNSLPATPDNAPQTWSPTNANNFVASSLGSLGNPRRGTMALNPAIYTAQYTNGVPAALSRLKPLISMFTNVVATADLMNVVQAVYMPTNSIAGSYEGYVPGPTGDRFGIPGVLDSPGELSEVFGRMTAGTVNASAPYYRMVTNVWGGNKPTLPQTGANTVFADGWTKVNNSGTTIEAGASAFPKELLRAVGAQMSPRTRFFHIYICTQSFGGPWTNGQPNGSTKIASEIWKEVLVERDNQYNEYVNKPQYKIVWEKAL